MGVQIAQPVFVLGRKPLEVPKRQKMERSLTRRLSRLNSRKRRELVALIGNPPDATKVPQSFWDEVARETEEEVTQLLFLMFLASANYHAWGSERKPSGPSIAGLGSLMMVDFDKDASSYSSSRGSSVASSVTAGAITRFSNAMKDLEREGQDRPLSQGRIDLAMVKVLGPSSAVTVATTEMTAAQSKGAEQGLAVAGGVDPGDVWVTERDARVCPICEPLNGFSRAVWGAQYPSGPPAHPNSRGTVRYVNQPRGT